MSESFDIQSSQKTYGVRIDGGLVGHAFDGTDDFVVVCDEALLTLWPQLNHPRVITVVASESEKTLDSVASVIERMREMKANRETRMIAIGGGIVQDVATFSASAYMRGIAWRYYPTTLLGMVDSCIGGKSSINVGQFKNIAGNYYPPDEILIDPQFCDSLPITQKIAGLCEAVKICFAKRDGAFESYLRLSAKEDLLSARVLTEIIALSLRTKKEFIEEDEFDHGVRLLLNFGHTFGHALEGASGFRISHGVAVGLGVLAAIRASHAIGLYSETPSRAELLAHHLRGLLQQVPDLRESLAAVAPSDALMRFKSDKKHGKTEYVMILVDAEGYLVRHRIPISEDSDRLLRDTFKALSGELDEIQ